MISKLINKWFGKKEKTPKTTNQKVHNEQEDDDKHFLDFDLMNKQVLVQFESTYRHQEIVFRRATEDNRITLGEILSGLFELEKSSIESMAVMYRLGYMDKKASDEKILDDSEAIWNYDLFSCILKNKSEDGHFTHGMFHETTLVVKSKERNCILTITSIGGTDTLKYLRVTLMSPDNNETDDCTTSYKTQNKPIIISFILSYTEIDENPELDYYEQIERSVGEKLDTKRYDELDDVEESFIHGMHEYRPDYYYGYGKWLYDQNRFFDTYVTLERAYNYFKANLDENNENWQTAYYTTCNLIGNCLSKLDREDEASYYYKQGQSIIPLNQPNDLALCKARLGDPSGLWLMNNWLMMVAQKYGDHENWSEEIKQFSVDVPVALAKRKKEMDAYIASSPHYDNRISIGFVLDRIFGIKQKNLADCMFIYDLVNDQFISRINDTETIINYVLNSEQANDKVFVLSCTYVYYNTKDEVDKSILCYNAPIIISTHTIKGENSSAAMRVDMMRCNFANDDDKRQSERINMPINVTFTLGFSSDYNYTPSKESLLEAIRKAIELETEWRIIESYKLAKWVFATNN